MAPAIRQWKDNSPDAARQMLSVNFEVFDSICYVHRPDPTSEVQLRGSLKNSLTGAYSSTGVGEGMAAEGVRRRGELPRPDDWLSQGSRGDSN